MLCAHIDTVPLTDRVEVELVDGVYRNRRDAILGADNKAGVAVILEAARRWAASGAPCRRASCVFTTSEEVGLRGRAGVRHAAALEAEFGFVLDHAAPIGAHGGGRADLLRRPCRVPGARRARGHPARGRAQRDRGRGARRSRRCGSGRLDEETTANVGRDPRRSGGERRARALHDRGGGPQPRRRQGVARPSHAMVDTITWAASATETDVDTTIEEHFRAYRIPESDPTVVIASAALRDCGVEPVPPRPAGAATRARSRPRACRCLNLAIGVELNHTPRRAGQRGGAREGARRHAAAGRARGRQ